MHTNLPSPDVDFFDFAHYANNEFVIGYHHHPYLLQRCRALFGTMPLLCITERTESLCEYFACVDPIVCAVYIPCLRRPAQLTLLKIPAQVRFHLYTY